MSSKQQRTQAAIDIAMSQIPAGQVPKVVVRATAGPAAGQAAATNFGLLGGLLGGRVVKDVYIVLTADWMAVVQASWFSGKPNALLAFGARDANALSDVKIGRGRTFSGAVLRIPGAEKPTRLKVHPGWKKELEAFAADLSSARA